MFITGPISQCCMNSEVLTGITAVTTNTSPRRVFLSVETWVFVDVNQLFPWFSLAEKVPSSLNKAGRLTRIISHDDVVFNYFMKMKDYIVKTARSLRAQWNSRNTLYKVFRLFTYLIVWKHESRGRIAKEYKFKEAKDTTPTRDKVSSEYRTLFWKRIL